MRFVLVLLGALLALPMPAEAARPGRHHHSVSARHGKKRHKKHRKHHRKHGRKKHHRKHRSIEL